MGILAAFDQSIQNATYNDRDGWFHDWLRGDYGDDSGFSVNERNAMREATVWKCVNWRAKMLGMLPKKIYERTEMLGRAAQKEARNHPLYKLIHTAPNPSMTSFEWFALISADIHLWGNTYAYIERAPRSARIVGLWRILPDAIRIEIDLNSGERFYLVRYGDGHEEKFYSDEILHVPGLGFDGIHGYRIRMQSQSLGWAKATRQSNSKFYENSFRPTGLLVSPQALKPEIKKNLIDNLRAQGKSGGLALIEGALEYKPLGIPPDDQQFLGTTEFQDEDTCGIMEVYPHEVGIMRRLTFNNVEQLTISSITRNLQPLVARIEQSFDLQLLSDRPSSGYGGGSERDRYFHEWELKVLLRGDTGAQTAYIKEMIGVGVYSPNDGRDYLGLSPYEGGDVYVVNRAYGPVESIDEWTMTSGDPAGNPPALPAKTTEGPAPVDSRILAIDLFSGIFRDAIGRILNREPKTRERAASDIFSPPMTALAALFEINDAAFIDGYVGVLSQRSQMWKKEQLESIVTEELDRGISAMEKRQ